MYGKIIVGVIIALGVWLLFDGLAAIFAKIKNKKRAQIGKPCCDDNTPTEDSVDSSNQSDSTGDSVENL